MPSVLPDIYDVKTDDLGIDDQTLLGLLNAGFLKPADLTRERCFSLLGCSNVAAVTVMEIVSNSRKNHLEHAIDGTN